MKMNRYSVVFIVAVLVRLILSVVFINIFSEWPTGSSITFRIGLAEGILSGEGFSYNGIPNLYQTPLYPFLLAVIFGTLGNHWWSIALFQSIFEGISGVFIAKIGGSFSKHGWLAGMVYALYPYAAMQSLSILDTSLLVLIFIMTVYYYLQFVEKRKLHNLILASFFLGIGILDRPSIIAVAPAFFLFLIVRGYNWKLIMQYTCISALISGLILSSWVLRNYLVTKQFPIYAVGGQHYMWYSHNEHIYNILRRSENPDILSYDPRYPMSPRIKVSEFFEISPTKQVELANSCSSIAKKWVRDNKAEVLKYSLYKLGLFLSWEYMPKRPSIQYHNLRLLVHRLTNAPIVILGWIGLILLFFRRWETAVYILVITAVFIFVHVTSVFDSRHKIPLDALFITLMPLSVYYLHSTTKDLSKRIAKALHLLS